MRRMIRREIRTTVRLQVLNDEQDKGHDEHGCIGKDKGRNLEGIDGI